MGVTRLVPRVQPISSEEWPWYEPPVFYWRFECQGVVACKLALCSVRPRGVLFKAQCSPLKGDQQVHCHCSFFLKSPTGLHRIFMPCGPCKTNMAMWHNCGRDVFFSPLGARFQRSVCVGFCLAPGQSILGRRRPNGRPRRRERKGRVGLGPGSWARSPSDWCPFSPAFLVGRVPLK